MNLEIVGKVYFQSQVELIGSNQIPKKILVVETEGQFAQKIPVEFIKDKVDLLANLQIGQVVKVHVNIRGSEYLDKSNVTRFGLNFQGWKVE